MRLRSSLLVPLVGLGGMLVGGAAGAQPAEDLETRFRRLDMDRDGRLSAVETGSAAFFRAADRDGDGFVTLDPAVRAIVAGEPANVLYTGMLTTGDYGPRLEMMAEPERFFTPELRQRTRENLRGLRAPVLILHSDQHDLRKLNAPLFVPLMKEAGVQVDYREYPGYGHGFYFGGGDDRWRRGADEKVVTEFMRDVQAFLTAAMPAGEPRADAPRRAGWVTPAVRAPGVTQHTFPSAAARTAVSFHVYTPESYERQPARRFPVLYWLHGTGGGLAGVAPLAAWFDAAIRAGKLPPVLVVFPNGLATSMWCDAKDGSVPMETVVVRELVPHVDATFRTIARREGRIVEGFSMGGYGAARLGFKFPDVFGAVSCLAGGPLDLEFAGPRTKANPAERAHILRTTFGGDLDYFRAQSPFTIVAENAAAVRGRVRVRQAVGERDFTAALNREFSVHLEKHRIAHAFTVVPGVGHEPLALLQGLGEENWRFYRDALPKGEAP